MRSCFVSIPFGIKSDPAGRALDFDHLYFAVIRPAVEAVELECRRLDDYPMGAIWHKTLFEAIVGSDFVIADVSTANPNVFYELGVRHALRRGRTILISAGGPLPGNISYARVLWYEPDANGRLTGPPADAFRTALQSIIRESRRSTVNDSPVYEFFPDLEVILPSELGATPRRRTRRAKPQVEFARSVVESPARARSELVESEVAVRAAQDDDPTEYLTVLRRYRDVSDWDRVISLAGDAPPALAQSSEVRHLLALALNRRRHTGDQDRAIALMGQHIAETGGDSEAFSILGLIYKDRCNQARARGDTAEANHYLDLAIAQYREAFIKDPRDIYAGTNLVTLLLQRGDAQWQLDELVPQVRAIVQEKLSGDRPDYWDVATELQLAAIARDWEGASQAAVLAGVQATAPWMIETTVRELRGVGENFPNPADRKRLGEILRLIAPDEAKTEVENA